VKPWPIVGHQWAARQLQLALESGEVPHALLITGPESIGKHTLAETFVAALLCRSADDKPCGDCLSCRKLRSGNHPDFMLVEPDDRAARLRIDPIRQLEQFLMLTPRESLRKVALLGAFERATVSAANALLKTLEEPPAYAHLILLATDADLLLPTIVSRTQQINLRPLSAGQVSEALVARWGVDAETAHRLARLSGGRLGWAVQAATSPETYERMHTALETLIDLLRKDLPERFEVARALARDDAQLLETFEVWSTFWRDVLMLQTASGEMVTHAEHRDILATLASSTALDETVRVLTTLEAAQAALLANANTQLLVENLLLDLPTIRWG